MAGISNPDPGIILSNKKLVVAEEEQEQDQEEKIKVKTNLKNA